MKIVFFGNRGSRPLGASEDSPFMRYGGDTTAIGILCGDHLLGIDAGSGFYKWQYTLGSILGQDGPHHIDVFFTHYHSDHVKGIPQAQGLFQEGNSFGFYGPVIDEATPQSVFEKEAHEPYNPNLSKAYRARIVFNALGGVTPQPITFDDGVQVEYMPVPHGKISAFAYRITHGDQSICIISDAHHEMDENNEPVLNKDIVEFAKGADALVYDCQYTDAEYKADPKCQKIGHSTGEQGVRIAAAAGIPLLMKHHHNPLCTDDDMDRQVSELQAYGNERDIQVIAAKPSLCLDLALTQVNQIESLLAQDTPQKRYQAIRGELAL